jgi:hypothetical protein
MRKFWKKRKKKTGERNNKKTREENFGRDSGRKKDVGRNFRKITI